MTGGRAARQPEARQIIMQGPLLQAAAARTGASSGAARPDTVSERAGQGAPGGRGHRCSPWTSRSRSWWASQTPSACTTSFDVQRHRTGYKAFLAARHDVDVSAPTFAELALALESYMATRLGIERQPLRGCITWNRILTPPGIHAVPPQERPATLSRQLRAPPYGWKVKEIGLRSTMPRFGALACAHGVNCASKLGSRLQHLGSPASRLGEQDGHPNNVLDGAP